MERISATIRISKEVLKEAKIRAVQNEISLGQFIESAILHELQRFEK
jgi:predicted HicB family RNase H-like nuclease